MTARFVHAYHFISATSNFCSLWDRPIIIVIRFLYLLHHSLKIGSFTNFFKIRKYRPIFFHPSLCGLLLQLYTEKNCPHYPFANKLMTLLTPESHLLRYSPALCIGFVWFVVYSLVSNYFRKWVALPEQINESFIILIKF